MTEREKVQIKTVYML